MKYIRKKIIKGFEYYYFDFGMRIQGTKKLHLTRYLGREIPTNLRTLLQGYFKEIGDLTAAHIPAKEQKYFPPSGIKKIEISRARNILLHHELYSKEMKKFRALFYILFVLNSNRAEGSKVTRPDIEKIMKRKTKPVTAIDKEIINSIDAINFAFSHEMKWNEKSIKKIHAFLFHNIHPEIAGKYKKVNNVVGDASQGKRITTTPWREVRKAMKKLLIWFAETKKQRKYIPTLALEFHWRFEAIHPFEDGNGRVGRILLNALLVENGFMPVIYFSENHRSYCNALGKAREGNSTGLAKHFVECVKKTQKAIEKYDKEGIIKGGSSAVGKWKIQKKG